MANKQKAWRLGAESINQQRQFDRKIPTARQQKQTGVKIKGSTWLLDGLLIRAGIIDPLPLVARPGLARYDYAKLETLWSKTKKWLGIK